MGQASPTPGHSPHDFPPDSEGGLRLDEIPSPSSDGDCDRDMSDSVPRSTPFLTAQGKDDTREVGPRWDLNRHQRLSSKASQLLAMLDSGEELPLTWQDSAEASFESTPRGDASVDLDECDESEDEGMSKPTETGLTF